MAMIFDLDSFIKNHFKIASRDFGAAIQKYDYELFIYSLKCLWAGFDMIRIAKGIGWR
jgi:hypothetical protein